MPCIALIVTQGKVRHGYRYALVSLRILEKGTALRRVISIMQLIMQGHFKSSKSFVLLERSSTYEKLPGHDTAERRVGHTHTLAEAP